MKRTITILLALVMVLSILLAGCGGAQTTAPKEETKKTDETTAAKAEEPKKEEPKTQEAKFDPANTLLSVLMPVKGHPVHRIVQLGFLEKAKQLGYKAEVDGIDGSSSAELWAAGETALSKGIKGMLVWGGDESCYPFIKKCRDAGVKTVIPHFKHDQAKIPELDANLSADPYKYGQEVAKAIGEKLKGKKGSVAITQGSMNITENSAAKGFTEGMKAYPDIKVLAPVEEGFDPPAAIAKAAAIIQGNKDLLGAFGTTGGSPQTWSGAMDQTKRPDLVCVGMDYTEQNIDLVKQGKIFAIVAQPLYEEASKSAEILDKLLRGEKVEYFTPLDAPVVTKDGIDQYADIIKRVKEWFK